MLLLRTKVIIKENILEVCTMIVKDNFENYSTNLENDFVTENLISF